MNCPKCGAPVSSRKNYCDSCGSDITVYRRIIRLSNRFYNSGLEKAKVRDLSGAADDLRKSLGFNKKNTDARNLLGLVYYEMGETVAALSEWVISKNFKNEENDADLYLEMVQDNPTELENTNQAIRKYNLALEAAKEQNDDLAIIQLRKVVSLHGNFLRALHLLSLLLIKTGDYDKARKYLLRAKSIDIANTTTLRYLAEIEREDPETDQNQGNYWDGHENGNAGKGIEVRSTYREDKPNVMVFVNLLLGVLIGIAVVYYLIVPTIKTNIREEYDSQKVDYSAELSSKTATITQQERKIDSLEKQVAELQEELNNVTVQTIEVEVGAEQYNAFFDAWKAYRTLKASDYTDEELENLALQLWSLDMNGVENQSALSILNEMRDDIYPKAARKIYKAGKALYDNADYDAAAGMLEAAVAFNGENDAAMYYLGKSYQAVQNYEKAIYYYKMMIEVCPNSTLKEYIPQRLRECGYTE